MIFKRRWVKWLMLVVLLAASVQPVRWLWIKNVMRGQNLFRWFPDGSMNAPLPKDSVLIFAPHPDDETLGCGGYIQRAASAGTKTRVVLITNGEYPEIDVFLFERKLSLKPQAFIDLGYRRQRETMAALRFLGLSDDAVTFFGFPNHYIEDMWLSKHWLPADAVTSRRTRSSRSPYRNSMTPRAVYCGQSLLDDVEKVLSHDKPDMVITLHPNDVHHDHWPTYAVVRFAVSELACRGHRFARDTAIYTYLIHQDSWPTPRGYKPKLDLQPPSALVENHDTDWKSLPLTPSETAKKRRAIALYRTQLGGSSPLLRSFARANELFGIIPTQEWPSDESVPVRDVIRDPAADMVAGAANPRGDIETVRLARNRGRMFIEVATRVAAAKKISYHLSIHAGGSGVDDRTIVEYHWQGRKAWGQIVRNGELRALDAKSMKVHKTGNTSTLETDWPLEDKSQSFFLLRVWTMRGSRLVDETETTTFAISGR